MQNGTRTGVLAVVQLPPPVTGLANVNLAVIQRLEAHGLLQSVVNIAAPSSGSRTLRMLVRLGRTALAAWEIVKRRKTAATLYMPLDSRAGLFLNMALLWLANTLGYKSCLHHHNFSYIDNRSSTVDALLKVARGSLHVFLCELMAERFVALYETTFRCQGHDYTILPNAFMIDIQDNEPELTDRITIGHLSNLSVEKGSVDFVEVFRDLKHAGHDVRGVVAGPIGDETTRTAMMRTLAEYPDDFFWVGPKRGEGKNAFYRGLDVFVFASRYVNEAQPLVLLEAMAGGGAILTTPRGCCACDHEDTPGLIIPEERFRQEAVRWIADLEQTPGARLALKRRAMEQAQAKNREASAKFSEFLQRIGGAN